VRHLSQASSNPIALDALQADSIVGVLLRKDSTDALAAFPCVGVGDLSVPSKVSYGVVVLY
jgi:hypothetical protein